MASLSIKTKCLSNFNNFSLRSKFKEKELIKRSGRKYLYVLIELDIFLATVGPKIDKKKLQ